MEDITSVAADEALREERAHAGANGAGIVRVGAVTENENARDARGFSGANDGAEIAWRVDGLDGEPLPARAWADIPERDPVLPDDGANALRVHCEGEISVEVRRELVTGDAGSAKVADEFLADGAGEEGWLDEDRVDDGALVEGSNDVSNAFDEELSGVGSALRSLERT